MRANETIFLAGLAGLAAWAFSRKGKATEPAETDCVERLANAFLADPSLVDKVASMLGPVPVPTPEAQARLSDCEKRFGDRLDASCRPELVGLVRFLLATRRDLLVAALEASHRSDLAACARVEP